MDFLTYKSVNNKLCVMRILDIYCVHFLTNDGEKLSIGGVETYLLNLINLANDIGIRTRVFQMANIEFEKHYNSAIVYGIKTRNKNVFNDLYMHAINSRGKDNNYVNLIASDLIIPSWKVPHSIVIQHGIPFDANLGSSIFLLAFLKRCFDSYKRIKKIHNVDVVVCVDNNYICWYRTQTPQRDVVLLPIMNFTQLVEASSRKDSNVIRIVFARRFVKIRGTRLFAPVAKSLIEKYDNLEIVFAGEGPEEEYLRSMFKSEDRVKFTKFNTNDSLKFHQQFDIAVVPTVYSEGTSLSLLEAMAAGCSVVCTNVGGMTNIILDGFNGLMTRPDYNELFDAISQLIEDKNLRNSISKHAVETVSTSFSLESWRRKWSKVLLDKFANIEK